MIKLSTINKPELFLIFLLIIELLYSCLIYAGRLKERSFEHDHMVYAQIASTSVQSRSDSPHAMTGAPILAGCILSASRTYELPAEAVMGIMSVEGGHIGQEVGPNFNGTYDLGLMQVNSLWVPQLAQLWHVDYQTARHWLRDNGCENVYVGAWILKQKIVETGTLYRGIAFYHSATRGRGIIYANKVASTMERKGFLQHK